MLDKDSMRCVFPASESIIFAENGNSDSIADNIAGFTQAETSLKKHIFGDYLQSEFARAGATQRKIAMLFSISNGRSYRLRFLNWLLGYNVPTPEQYQSIRDYLNSINCKTDYLRREYEDLRREYEG